MILTASTESEALGCKASRVSGRMMAARNCKRSGEEPDVGQALIGTKAASVFFISSGNMGGTAALSSLFFDNQGTVGFFCTFAPMKICYYLRKE